MVEVFKTNVADELAAAKICQSLQSIFPEAIINFDLQDCDRILRVEVDAQNVQQTVKDHLNDNNFDCEAL